jgi:hypothetical protein
LTVFATASRFRVTMSCISFFFDSFGKIDLMAINAWLDR